MVTNLNKLAELIRKGSLPAWLREQLTNRKDEILQGLQTKGVYILEGPHGERIEIRAEKENASAA